MEEEEYLIEELRKIEIRKKEREKKQQVLVVCRFRLAN